MADEYTVSDDDALKLVTECFRRASRGLVERQAAYTSRYRSYRGILEMTDNEWESQLSPPYSFQIVETIFALIASEHPRDRVIPMGAKDVTGAKALESLLQIQRGKDNFNEKYAQWVKQGLVLGASPAKVAWDYEHCNSRKRRWIPDGIGGYHEVMQTEPVTYMSQPTFIPHDLSDFFYDPSVSRMRDASFCIFRYWVSIDSLRQDAAGQDGTPGIYSQAGVNEIAKAGPASYGTSSRGGMNDDYIKRDRKGLVELLEYWSSDNLIVVANRKTVLRNQDHPYAHRRLPVVMATPVPDMYSMEGLSEVDLIRDLQSAIWSLLNQRLDNTRLISNGIIMVRDTIDDVEKLVFSPRAIWPVSDPAEVQMWTPNHNITESSLEAEKTLKDDLMSITAAIPYLSGASPDMVDNNTATGVNILSNNAMNRVLAKRQRFFDALAESGRMEIDLNQEFWVGPIEIQTLDPQTNEWSFPVVSAQDIVCDCDYGIEETTESLNRQERRQEALLLFNTLVTAFPAIQAAGLAINFEPALEKLGDAFDIKDIQRWLKPAPAPQIVPGPAPGQVMTGPDGQPVAEGGPPALAGSGVPAPPPGNGSAPPGGGLLSLIGGPSG